MTDNSLNMSIPIKFEIKTPPRGMTDYDPKALSPEHQTELNAYKISVRKENLLYLLKHPEVKAIVAMVFRRVVHDKPRNVLEFIAQIFSRSERDIRKEVNAILNEMSVESESIPYCDFDEWDY